MSKMIHRVLLLAALALLRPVASNPPSDERRVFPPDGVKIVEVKSGFDEEAPRPRPPYHDITLREALEVDAKAVFDDASLTGAVVRILLTKDVRAVDYSMRVLGPV